MKILIICPDWFPNISGFGTSCYEFAKNAEKEHTVTILTPSQKKLDKRGLDVRPVTQIVNLANRNPVVLGLLREIRKVDYDIIMIYSYMYEMNARVAIYKRLGLIKKPVVLMYRGSLEDEVLAQLSTPIRLAKITYDRTYGAAVFKYSDYIISNSKPTLVVMKKKYGLKSDKMSYIPNSININEYIQSKQNNKRVLFVGRLIQNKGIKFFEQIVQNIPKDWKFTIAGDGPMENIVLDLAKKYKNVEYLGKLTKIETNKIISKSDILILPTFAEGSPRAVLEASASGIPSIAFDVGDVPTVLNHDKNGYTIPRYDIDVFVKRMKELIDNSSLRKKKGDSARLYAQKNLNWNKTYIQTMKFLEMVVKNSKKKKT